MDLTVAVTPDRDTHRVGVSVVRASLLASYGWSRETTGDRRGP
jgi:hypothetical protein